MNDQEIKVEDLVGHFHCHLTYLVAKDSSQEDVVIPHGWKNTVIVLSRVRRSMVDYMITKHYIIPSAKTPTIQAMRDDIDRIKELLAKTNKVIRVKVEHETLPTIAPDETHYREAHMKVLFPNDLSPNLRCNFIALPGWQQSSNPNATTDKGDVYFFNRRFYEGTVTSVDKLIDEEINTMRILNPDYPVLEVKKESAIYDSNQDHDSWWLGSVVVEEKATANSDTTLTAMVERFIVRKLDWKMLLKGLRLLKIRKLKISLTTTGRDGQITHRNQVIDLI